MIRVIRILEYTYPDNITAEEDMAMWAVPANGTRKIGVKAKTKTIKSATLVNLWAQYDE